MKSQPSWQQRPCPQWCTVEHAEDDHPEDHSHRDDGISVPAVLRRQHFHGDALTDCQEHGLLTVGRWQRDGDLEVWYSIGDEQGTAWEVDERTLDRVLTAVEQLRRSSAAAAS